MSASLTLPRDVALCHLPHPFGLAHGGCLDAPHVAFELVGPAGAPVVAVLGGISAGRHLAATEADPERGWWDGFVGAGRAVDTRRFRVLSIDWIGGAGASTRAEAGFPSIDVDDQAGALARVCDTLGVRRLHAIVGSSYGGMVALAFAAGHGHRVDRVVAIATTNRSSASATACRSLQRRIVRLGLDTGRVDEALALARGLAMTSYRSRAELDLRFAAPPQLRGGGFRFPVESYLEARGQSFARRFTAAAFVCLSESIDLCRVDPACIDTPTTLCAIRSDQLVTPDDVRSLAAALAGPVELVEIDSVFGHDGFLKEVDALTPLIRGALEVVR